MTLDQLTLRDFGVFRGRHVLEIGPVDGKPVVLFGGMNGAGKTTLLDAMMLVLYGERATCSRRGGLPYKTFLQDSINDAANPADGARLELAFRHWADGRMCSYLVRRHWHCERGGVIEEVEVHRDGHLDRALTETWNEQVERFIPSRIAGLFFFDGEKIEHLADLANASEFLHTAVNAVLGLDVVDQLDVDLRIVRRSLKGEQLNDEQQTKLRLEEDSLARLRKELSDAQAKRASVVQQLDAARREFEKQGQQYQRQGGGLYEQRAAVEAVQQAAHKRLLSNEERLRDAAAGALPLLLVQELVSCSQKQAVAEAEARRNGLVLDMLEERDEKLLGALAKAGVTGMPVRNVAAWLKSDRDKTAARASRVEQYLGLSPEATDAIVRLERTGISAEVRGLRDELKATAESRESFDAAERKLAMIPDQQALGLLVAERERLRQAAIARETELGIVDETVKSLEGRVALQEKRVDGLVDVAVDEKFRGADSERSIAAIDRVGPALAEFRKLVTQRNVVRLEELITESLNQLLHKRSLLSRISIAPDTLRLRLYDRAGREVGPQRISAGERQLLAVSMVWGLARASNRPLPTIIDTPLGRLDSRHRIHLVERYFPVASHQVVLLSTDEEVNEKYYGKLKPALGRSYRLEFEEGTQSTSVTQGYFW